MCDAVVYMSARSEQVHVFPRQHLFLVRGHVTDDRGRVVAGRAQYLASTRDTGFASLDGYTKLISRIWNNKRLLMLVDLLVKSIANFHIYTDLIRLKYCQYPSRDIF
jgi:hypothetical protein